MAENKPESSSRQAELQDLLDQATEETAHHARVRAESAAAVPKVTKERTVAGALALAVPVLALLLTVNVFRVSLVDLITPTPSPSVARRLTQEALDDMVKEIEGFREDYQELPESLGEVAPLSPGHWTYSRRPGGSYQVVLERYGQVVTFDSQSKKVIDEARP